MAHIREEILERFLLEPSSIDPESSEAINTHLAECATCRTISEFLRDFYARFENTGNIPPARVAAFVNSIAPPASVIPLHPFRYGPEVATGETRYTSVLAAVTDTTLSRRYKVLATFAAEDQSTVVRIVLDQTAGTITIYVQTGVKSRREFAILSLPDLGLDLVCDKNGEVETAPTASMLSADLGSTTAVLRTWVHRLDFVAEELVAGVEGGRLSERRVGEETIHVAFKGGELSIEPEGRAPGRYRFALVHPDEAAPLLVPLTDEGGRCPLHAFPARLTVRLYQ